MEDEQNLVRDRIVIPRQATRRSESHGQETRLLQEWNELDAYVLLGEPGMGKTVAFQQEAQADPAGSLYITARDFITVGPPPGSADKILFIDALDERRASSGSTSGPLDEIRIRLNELGRPRFRLSCREADWIASDATHLRAVAPKEKVEELHLEPLSEPEVLALLEHWTPTRVNDPHAFLDKARRQRLAPLLGNPLLLDLLVQAVKDGQWPASRQETYLLACRSLATEHNEEHRAAQRQAGPNVGSTLEDAGLLCALLLLSDSRSYLVDTLVGASGDILIDHVPPVLGVPHARMMQTLASKLFAAEGPARTPRHRTIAEFLAAQAIARLVANGLPVSRTLALMSGPDGGIVEPLRGLFAWLAAACPAERSLLIERDPLGLVLYGDVHPFAVAEKRQILDALYREATRFQWFRKENWEAHPFGALGTADMEYSFQALLESRSREPAHEALLECVIDAIEYGDEMPSLAPVLERIVRDSTDWQVVRNSALDALLKLAASFPIGAAKQLLDDIENEKVSDPDDELLGRLLTVLYPNYVPASAIMRYLHVHKDDRLIGHYHMFWAVDIVRRTPPQELAVLADGLAAILERDKTALDEFRIASMAANIFSAALTASGENESVERLYRWLRATTDEHGLVALRGTDAQTIHNWLSAHPQRQKEIFAYALTQVSSNAEASYGEFWRCEELLYRANRPHDWYWWMLHCAANAAAEQVTRFCFERAAITAISQLSEFEITLDDIDEWVQTHAQNWPQADQWRTELWTCKLGEWQQQEYLREREQAAAQAASRLKRQQDLTPHLSAVFAGTAPPWLMQDIVFAYDGRFSDISGDTPEQRVQEYLVVSARDAVRAIDGLRLVLQRNDLPSANEIIDLHLAKNHYFFLQKACLLAAQLCTKDHPEAALAWSDALTGTMVAFFLVDRGTVPDWYLAVAKSKPSLVAAVLLPYAQQKIQDEAGLSIPGLHEMAQADGLAELARMVLPPLLHSFPQHATASQLRILNHELLRAALCHLDKLFLEELIFARHRDRRLDTNQHIVWLVGGLLLNPARYMPLVIKLVGSDRSRAVQLADVLGNLPEQWQKSAALDARLIGKLIELLAQHAVPERPRSGVIDYSDQDRIRDLVRSLTQQLAASPDSAAGIELLRLRALPMLAPWAVTLDACHYDHIKVARAAAFTHASVDAVAQTLANKSPANARDMAALLIDQIALLAAHIRFDDTNMLRLFWRDTAKKASTPKIENDCRDILLGILRPRMQLLGVHVEKESHAAGDKRADLQASAIIGGKRVIVPIEVKKEDHPAVWTAWQDQLIDRYATNPAAQGIGIYLVLWFGESPKKSPNGKAPKGAQQMAAWFNDLIPLEQQQQVSGLVLDLSKNSA